MRKLEKKITYAENTFEPHVTYYHNGEALTKPVSVDSVWKLGEEKAKPLIFSNVQSSMLSPDIPVITQEEYDAVEDAREAALGRLAEMDAELILKDDEGNE